MLPGASLPIPTLVTHGCNAKSVLTVIAEMLDMGHFEHDDGTTGYFLENPIGVRAAFRISVKIEHTSHSRSAHYLLPHIDQPPAMELALLHENASTHSLVSVAHLVAR